MKATRRFHTLPFPWLTALVALVMLVPSARAQQSATNWVAFNDYVPGPPADPGVNNGWGTAPNVNVYNLRGVAGTPPQPTEGFLTDYLTGQPLPAYLIATATGAPDYFGAIQYPNVDTPAYNLFHGIVDLGNANSAIGIRSSANTTTTMTFSNLDTGKRYIFRGTVVRGNNYLGRWTLCTILGATSFTDAHSAAVYTMENFPSGTMTNGQAAWNSGENRAEGAVVGWDDIVPSPDGTFAIHCRQYTDNPLPNGQPPTLSNYGYAICGFMLAEVGPVTPVAITAQPVPQTTVEQLRSFSLSVAIQGSTPQYQWYKDNEPIGSATARTYSVPAAALGESGDYYVVVSNPLNVVTSTVAHVTVNPDTTQPALVAAVGSATGTEITIQFSEKMNLETAPLSAAMDPVSYSISDGISGFVPNAVVANVNGSSVTLLVNPLLDHTLYTVSVNDATDLVGNLIAAGSLVQFRSWTTNGSNGLLFEAYDTVTVNSTLVSALTNHANFPNNPRDVFALTSFDSRLAYPDDTHEQYGARIRGIFVAPYSGNWKFYIRGDDGCELWLNPNGPSASGKVRIASALGYIAGPFAEESPGGRTSAPIPLTAGQICYIEMLYKEAAGGDYGQVTAKLDIDTNAPASLLPLTGNFIGHPAAPDVTTGGLNITQPASQNVFENSTATFSVTVNNISGLPISYQWSRDGLDIAGATRSSYSFGPVGIVTDDGARFRCRISTISASVLSDEAVLTVSVDNVPPSVLGVRGSFNPLNVVVSFSELVDPTIAQDTVYYSVGGTLPSGAVLGADGRTVTLQMGNPLAFNSTYPVEVTYARDLAGNELASPTNLMLRTFVTSPGFALQELYMGIGAAGTIAGLRGSPMFPDAPDQRDYVALVEGPLNTFDNYGTRLTGFVLPPVSGDYNFFFSSDDNGELYLSTDDNPANRVLIAQETSWNNPRMWTGDRAGGTRGVPPSNVSTNPIPLVAGQMYYFEALGAEGGGGDNTGVNWQPPGAPLPLNGSAPLQGPYIAALADPVGAVLNITGQPASVTVTNTNVVATFTVSATSTINGQASTKLAYQWYWNSGATWQVIAGANAATYSITTVAADNGAQFRCDVYIPGAWATSQPATLTIGSSVQPPRIGDGSGGVPPPSLSGTTFSLSFPSENGRTYTLQGNADLSNPNGWADIVTASGNGGQITLLDTSAAGPRRFYRIKVQ